MLKVAQGLDAVILAEPFVTLDVQPDAFHFRRAAQPTQRDQVLGMDRQGIAQMLVNRPPRRARGVADLSQTLGRLNADVHVPVVDQLAQALHRGRLAQFTQRARGIEAHRVFIVPQRFN